MRGKRKVPYTKSSLKPIRPKPQLLCDSKVKNSLPALVSPAVVKPQNSSFLQKQTFMFNCEGKNKFLSGVSTRQDRQKITRNVKDQVTVDVSENGHNTNNMISDVVSLGKKTTIILKEEDKDELKLSDCNDTISLSQSPSGVHSGIAFSGCLLKYDKTTGDNLNLSLRNLSAELERGNAVEKHSKNNIHLIVNKYNAASGGKAGNNSENILKIKEKAILKTFAKIAPCSSPSNDKGRNFFTIKRNGKRSLVVCRNVRERKLNFLPTDYCNSDRCCPNSLSKIDSQELSVQNLLDKVVEKSSRNCTAKSTIFIKSPDSISDSNIKVSSSQYEVNSDVEIINHIKEENGKNNSEKISDHLKPKILPTDRERNNKSLPCCNEGKLKNNLVSKILNGNVSLKYITPLITADDTLCHSGKSISKNGINPNSIKAAMSELAENGDGLSLLKNIAVCNRETKAKLNKFVLTDPQSNKTTIPSVQINRILQTYPRIAPRLKSVQNEAKAESNNNTSERMNSIICQTSTYHVNLLDSQKNHSLPAFRGTINGDIKNEENSSNNRNDNFKNSSYEQGNNAKRFKISAAICCRNVQEEKVTKNSWMEGVSQNSMLDCDLLALEYGSKQEAESCSVSQYFSQVNHNRDISAETITCSSPPDKIYSAPGCCNPIDNVDFKLLSFTELIALSQKFGKEVFSCLSLDEITEKALIELTSGDSNSSSSSRIIENGNQINRNSHMIKTNCCSMSFNFHQRNSKSDPCNSNQSDIIEFQQQCLKSINGETACQPNDTPLEKNTSLGLEAKISNQLLIAGNNFTNDIGKIAFLNHLDLHRSDNVFGISVVSPKMQEQRLDYAKNPCIPLHRIFKTFKTVRQTCMKSRNCGETETVPAICVASSLKGDFCNDTVLDSGCKLNNVDEPT